MKIKDSRPTVSYSFAGSAQKEDPGSFESNAEEVMTIAGRACTIERRVLAV